MKTKNEIKIHKIRCRLSIFWSVVIAVGLMANVQQAWALSLTSHNVLMLVNNARKANQLNQLQESSVLDKAANDKADDMIKHNYFAHTSPQGVSPWHWFKVNNYDYEYAGENLAIGFHDAVDQHNAWMNSPKHRENILNSNYQEIGIAIKEGVIDGQDTLITVQLFGKTAKKVAFVNNAENSLSSQKLTTNNKTQQVAGQISLSHNNFSNFLKTKQLTLISSVDFLKKKIIFLTTFFNNNQQKLRMLNGYLLLGYLIFYLSIFSGVMINELENWITRSLKIKNGKQIS